MSLIDESDWKNLVSFHAPLDSNHLYALRRKKVDGTPGEKFFESEFARIVKKTGNSLAKFLEGCGRVRTPTTPSELIMEGVIQHQVQKDTKKKNN